MERADEHLSPDRRYKVVLTWVEMRMSHWLQQPVILETATAKVVLDLSSGMWSADAVRWSEDSAVVSLDMRQ